MADHDPVIPQLNARPVMDVVEELAWLHKKTRANDRVHVPRVTLHFSSGRDLSGVIVHFSEDSRKPGVLLQNGSDAIYVEPRTLEAITVHDAAPFAATLSRGAVAGPLLAPPGAGAPPTKMELKRKLDVEAKKLGELVGKTMTFDVRWDEVPESGEKLRVLESIVTDTVEVLAAIAADEMGKDALHAHVEAVSFGDGGGKGVGLEKSTLAVSARLELGSSGRLEKPELRSAIERLL